MKRAPAPSSVGAPVGGRDQPAASSGTLTNIDADTAALLDRRVLTTALSPGNSSAGHEHFDFGASTGTESSAAARQTWIPFTSEDEYLLQAMASEIANVLKRRSLEATFHSLVADTENVASDPISKTLLSQYLQNAEAPEIKTADRPATPANTAESAASADDAAEKAARCQAAREAVMMGTIALAPSSNLSAAGTIFEVFIFVVMYDFRYLFIQPSTIRTLMFGPTRTTSCCRFRSKSSQHFVTLTPAAHRCKRSKRFWSPCTMGTTIIIITTFDTVSACCTFLICCSLAVMRSSIWSSWKWPHCALHPSVTI
jgi:hypothetical protein